MFLLLYLMLFHNTNSNNLGREIQNMKQQQMSTVVPLVRLLNQDSFFFRAIKANNIDELTMWNKNRFSAIPEHRVTRIGRLNGMYESILYFNNQVLQTLNEIDYDYETPVVIAGYKVKQDFTALIIGAGQDGEMLPEITEPFLHKESTKLNQTTLNIRKKYYDLTANGALAWVYPSVGNTDESYNLAIYPGLAKQYLEFVGAVVISKANRSGSMHIEFCFDSDYCLDYLKWHPELKRLFKLGE